MARASPSLVRVLIQRAFLSWWGRCIFLCLLFLCLLIDQVKPICDLVLLWQRMELESWPALLDEVQDRYEINAEKVKLGYLSL